MTVADSPGVELKFDLPEHWTLASPHTWDRAASALAAHSTTGQEPRHTPAASYPNAVATLLRLIGDPTSEEAVLVIASTVVDVVSLADLPDATWEGGSSYERGVEFATDVAASYFQLIVPVRDEAAGLAAVFTFTTPNITMIDLLEPGFRSIAATARFEVPRSQDDLP